MSRQSARTLAIVLIAVGVALIALGVVYFTFQLTSYRRSLARFRSTTTCSTERIGGSPHWSSASSAWAELGSHMPERREGATRACRASLRSHSLPGRGQWGANLRRVQAVPWSADASKLSGFLAFFGDTSRMGDKGWELDLPGVW